MWRMTWRAVSARPYLQPPALLGEAAGASGGRRAGRLGRGALQDAVEVARAAARRRGRGGVRGPRLPRRQVRLRYQLLGPVL